MGQFADLGGRSLPGWRAGVARAGGRSSWRPRCGCGNKHSFGPGRRAVKRLNGPTAMMPQASSAWAIAVGLSNLTLRARPKEFISKTQAGQELLLFQRERAKTRKPK